MITKTYNFLDRNSAKVMDTCVVVLLAIAGFLFADNIGTLFLITMSLLPLQEIGELPPLARGAEVGASCCFV